MTDALLTEATDDILTSVCTPTALRAAERDGWAPDMWTAVASAGLPWISVPEASGGQGGTLADALAVLRVAGRHGLPLPLAETGVLAGWLLSSAGLPVDPVAVTVAAARGLSSSGGTISGSAANVPWGRACEHIVALLPTVDGPVVAKFASADLRIERHTSLAGEPRDTVHFDRATPMATGSPAAGVDDVSLAERGALTRVVLMAGALNQVLTTTLRYTNERHQFGRPVARFQAVQQHLVHIAQQVAMLDMAADLAIAAADGGDLHFAVRAAKIVADDAARIATRAAHQAHGAMGMTQEYPLHNLTRRLWAWTREYGTGAEAAIALGAAVTSRPVEALWLAITDGALGG
jgi:acyl-CoA dehydrogenase